MENFDIGKITTYQAGVAQSTLHRLLQKLSDTILKPYGITKMQWMIIGIVLDAGKEGARISDIADSLGTTIAYLTTSINLLESRGILERRDNRKDSRSKLVTISAAFAPKCQVIEEAMRNALRQSIYAEIPRDEFLTYMKVMYRLIEVAKKQEKQCTQTFRA